MVRPSLTLAPEVGGTGSLFKHHSHGSRMAGSDSTAVQDSGIESVLGAQAGDFYRHVMTALTDGGIDYLVGGAFAFARYTGIYRMTKDFDVFVRPADHDRALEVLAASGFRTDLTFPYWLGKAYLGDDFVDLIYASGNGVAPVDDLWFEHALADELLGIPIRLCPAEEMIWQKSFLMERERFDGADVVHLLKARARELDWPRLLERFAENWRVLLIQLTLFGFVYPGERTRIPASVMEELLERLRSELDTDGEPGVNRGTLVSRSQYLVDVGKWGYDDARLSPRGNMSAEDLAHWTAAIDDK